MKLNFPKAFEHNNQTSRSVDSRKPWAIAVSISVLLAGFAILMISANSPIVANAPIEEEGASAQKIGTQNLHKLGSDNKNSEQLIPEKIIPKNITQEKTTPSGHAATQPSSSHILEDKKVLLGAKQNSIKNEPTINDPLNNAPPNKTNSQDTATRLTLANGIKVPRVKPITSTGQAILISTQKNGVEGNAPKQSKAEKEDKFTPSLKLARRQKQPTNRLAAADNIALPQTQSETKPTAILDNAAAFKVGSSPFHTHPLNLHPVTAFNPHQNWVPVFPAVDLSHTPNSIEFDPAAKSETVGQHNTPLINFDGDLHIPPQEHALTLKSGENFVDLLARANINRTDRNQVAQVFGQHMKLRSLQAGLKINLVTEQPNQTYFQAITTKGIPNYLRSLSVRTPENEILSLKRTKSGGFSAEKRPVQMKRRLQIVSGVINGNLYTSMRKQNTPDNIIHALANVFAFDVDFQRDIFSGDQFEAIYEAIYDEEGNLVTGGDIVFARLTWRGNKREKNYYLYTPQNGGQQPDYFDANGQSARRLLMKTPVDGARLSSNFGPRRHPILGYRKTHKGVDFAARRGTPIKATGDGVIERANRFGSYGNYIRIRHSNNYKTAYAHLKGFARGIKKGKRVRQGDIIGYIGTTGRSTGPHLHYEVHHKNKPVNPQKLKIATGVKLTGKTLNGFKQNRSLLDGLRVPREELMQPIRSTRKENDSRYVVEGDDNKAKSSSLMRAPQ